MRKIEYQEYMTKRTEKIKKSLSLKRKRASRSKPRSEVERKLLLSLDKNRFESWKKSGKIKIINSRKWKFSI